MHPIEATALIAEEPDELVCATCDMAFQSAWLLCQHCQLGHHMKIFKTSMLLLKKAHEKDNNDKSSPESSTCIADPSESVPDSFENIYHSSIQLLNRLSDVPQTTSNKEDVAVVTKTEVVHAPVDIDDDESGGDDNGNSDNAENNNSAMEIGLKQEPEEPSELDSSTSKEMWSVNQDLMMIEKSEQIENDFEVVSSIDKKKPPISRKRRTHLDGIITCRHCGTVFVKELNYVKHKIGISCRNLICKHCKKQFETQAMLRNHISTKHFSLLQCKKCGKSFLNQKKLRNHVLRHGSESHECEFCKKSFKCAEYLQKHLRVTHPAERKNFTCNECGKVFGWKSRYEEHKQVHSRFQCSMCNKSFKNKETLENHTHSHTTKQDLKCPKCDKTYSLSYNLDRHMQLMHTDTPQCVCSICGKKYYYRTELNKHMKTFHKHYPSVQPAQCHICAKMLRDRATLRVHVQLIHTNEKPFKCSECLEAFAHKYKLEIHKFTHTGTQFPCEICGKLFKCRKSVFAHVGGVHNKTSRQYDCEFCGKKFGRSYHLNRHLAIHTGKKFFHCDKCGTGFIQQGQLKTHKLKGTCSVKM